MTLRSRPASTSPRLLGRRQLLASTNGRASQRGAARVSAAWLIALVVLFLVAVAFAFLTQSDLSSLQESNDSLRASNNEAVAAVEVERQGRRDISRVLGFFPPETADPNSNIESAEEALGRLRDAFPDHLGASDETFEATVGKIISAYNARGATITELNTRNETIQSELTAAQKAASATASDKDETIAALRTQLADEQQNAAARQQDLEDRLAAAQEQTSERDGELRTTRSDFNAERRALEQEIARREVRISELANITKFAKEPFADKADGAVLTVSESLPYGWIDVGANQRLTTGTRFRVETGSVGQRRFKAWAEVTDLEANRAQVLFTDLVDRFDPVAPGDVVVNPLFDPTGERNAVLAGRFSGTYTRDELGVLLDRVGINVQEDLSLTTHFLIVGQELYYDPVTSEPLEDPLQPEDLPVYKQAEDQSVQIIPLQDLQAFFRAGA